MMLQGDRARGGVEIRARGVGWDSGPGVRGSVGIRAPGARCGFGPRARGGVGIRAPARGGVGFGPGAGWGLFGVRWEIFYLFAVFSPFG